MKDRFNCECVLDFNFQSISRSPRTTYPANLRHGRPPVTGHMFRADPEIKCRKLRKIWDAVAPILFFVYFHTAVYLASFLFIRLKFVREMQTTNGRPRKNAFLFFMDDFRAENPNRRQTELFRQAGSRWRRMTDDEKAHYFRLARPAAHSTPAGDNLESLHKDSVFVEEEPRDSISHVLEREPPPIHGLLQERPLRPRQVTAVAEHSFLHVLIIIVTVIVCMTGYFITKLF